MKRNYDIGPGFDRGMLSRRLRRPRVSNYDRYGSAHTQQIFGSNQMTNVNYFGVNSFVTRQLSIDIGIALLRHLMWKHYKLSYTNNTDPITPNYTVNSDPTSFTVYYDYRITSSLGTGAKGLTQLATFSFNTTKTVYEFGVWWADTIPLSDVFNGVLGHEMVQLKKYGFDSGDGFKMYDGLDTIRFKAFSTGWLKLQNSTLNDSGTTAIDVNNPNPVKGKIFKLKGLNPMLRDDVDYTAAELTFTDTLCLADDATYNLNDGIYYPTVQPNGQFAVVPSHTHFRNCVGMSTVFMQPGDIKTMPLKFKFFGTLNDFYFGVMRRNAQGNTGNNRRSFGISYLFALEQVIRTGASNILLNYQMNRTTGAFFVPCRPTLLKKWVSNITQTDNVIA